MGGKVVVTGMTFVMRGVALGRGLGKGGVREGCMRGVGGEVSEVIGFDIVLVGLERYPDWMLLLEYGWMDGRGV
jgi:hypothetical protein